MQTTEMQSNKQFLRSIVVTKQGVQLRLKMSYTRIWECVLGALAKIGLDESRHGVHSLRAFNRLNWPLSVTVLSIN